jgi:hypothetical protein
MKSWRNLEQKKYSFCITFVQFTSEKNIPLQKILRSSLAEIDSKNPYFSRTIFTKKIYGK